MTPFNPHRSEAIRVLIADFLRKRLADGIEKLNKVEEKYNKDMLTDDHPDRTKLKIQRKKLNEKFNQSNWLEDATKRVSQIQAVTHSLKSIHPKAIGTSLFHAPNQLPDCSLVSSRCLGDTYDIDVVGNAAALDVYAFLKLQYENKNFLDLALAGDADLSAALSEDSTLAQQWVQAFVGLVSPHTQPTSHTNAKQLYWLVGLNAHDGRNFHLIAPLYPTSLVHRIYLKIQEDRFSEDAKNARASRRAAVFHERAVHEYSNLAIQKIGGANPQNISQLNTERRGVNYLLASLPPSWKSVDVRPLLGVNSLFQVFGRRREVQQKVRALRMFLETKPPANLGTRNKVSFYLNDLIDELLQFSASLHSLPPHWSASADCALPAMHRLWLDPARTGQGVTDSADAADEVAGDFARWLNKQLRDPLPMGDAEFLHWQRLASDQLREFQREAA